MSGSFTLTTCVCQAVQPWAFDVIELEREYQNGHPPVLAGSLDQTQWCREAFRFVRSEFAAEDVTRRGK